MLVTQSTLKDTNHFSLTMAVSQYKITINTESKSHTLLVEDEKDIEPILDALYSMTNFPEKVRQTSTFPISGYSPYILHTLPNLSVVVSHKGLDKTYSNQMIPSRNQSRIDFYDSKIHQIHTQIQKPYILVYFYLRIPVEKLSLSGPSQQFFQDVSHSNINSTIFVAFKPSNQRDADLFVDTLQKLELLPIYDVDYLNIQSYQDIVIDGKQYEFFRSSVIKDGVLSKFHAYIKGHNENTTVDNNDDLWNKPIFE